MHFAEKILHTSEYHLQNRIANEIFFSKSLKKKSLPLINYDVTTLNRYPLIRKLRLLSFLLLAAVYTGYSQVPVASIVATPLSGCPPLAVSFNDASTNTPTSWSWNFGAVPPNVSQATSTTKNNSVLFNTPGVYTVTLISKNASGSSAPTTVQITVNPVPTADFTQDKTTGCYPTTVHFT